MFNIKFKGKYTDENQLKRGSLPHNAVKFKEPNSISTAFLLGGLISLPILLLSTTIMIMKIENFLAIPVYHYVFIGLLSMILTYVHELIHAFSLPRYSEKEIWTKMNEGALFVHFNSPLSKYRFVWVCMAPNIILGYLPFLLFSIGVFDFNNIISVYVGILSWVMILTGIGDYLNAYNAIRQVPPDARIINHGINSYWVR
ncbi:DUF3267 domain-containing protein [Virgibacillus xinjiangensis]|uniref:DUF3267 domain-containing protein n=1 Tax=Virgibacillus xinjiangensis TaxID=393090 RepID=A0ABV7CT83_9BACI